ncbi:hypothetical protein BHM03_00011043 [Ensete ventricosum]|nr:hypothetical protein BHM03_00011043 [Ensete ventricosum]
MPHILTELSQVLQSSLDDQHGSNKRSICQRRREGRNEVASSCMSAVAADAILQIEPSSSVFQRPPWLLRSDCRRLLDRKSWEKERFCASPQWIPVGLVFYRIGNLFSEVFKSLLISNLPPDITSYNKVAEAFHKVADSDLVVNFIKDVCDITFGKDPTVINRIIFVTAKFGQIDKSLMIFKMLKNLDPKLDTVTFNTVLAILGKAGRINEMLAEFMVMKDLGHIPDIFTYSTLINCLRRLGRLDLCKTIANEMLEKGFEMDLLTYTALVDAYGRAGHVEDALRTFEEMKKSQRPSVYAYRSIISDLKRAGKFELALHLSAEMNSNTRKLAGPEDFKQKRKSRWKIKQVG